MGDVKPSMAATTIELTSNSHEWTADYCLMVSLVTK